MLSSSFPLAPACNASVRAGTRGLVTRTPASMNLSVITICCFFLLLKLLLCEFLRPGDTAGPTFLFAREHRVAVFIRSGVKKPHPVTLTASVSRWFLPL